MNVSLTLAAALLATCAAPALASGFDCIAPEFPQRSTSNESARRVQKQVKLWRACYAGHDLAGQANADAQKLNAEVETGLQNWMDATRLASSRSGANEATLAHIERERTLYLRSIRLR